AEPPPQQGPDPLAPAPGDGQTQQGQPEEQTHHQGADPDELLAGFRRHVMRRFAYVGTTPKRSALAANVTSSARSASASWRAASESASASFQLANCSLSARKLTGAPTNTGSPPCAATSAGVPLVVASTIVFPATAAGVISRGELPSAKPSILTLRRSPASRTPSFSRCEASRTASSDVAAGITAFAPLASAVTIVVVARSTSITTMPRPPRSPAPRPRGVK